MKKFVSYECEEIEFSSRTETTDIIESPSLYEVFENTSDLINPIFSTGIEENTPIETLISKNL